MKSLIGMVVTGLCVMASAASVATADPIVVHVLPVGDGYFHDELGSSSDYFDATATSIGAYYNYWGTSDTLAHNISYAQFSLATPSTSPIQSATLNFYMESKEVYSNGQAGTVNHVANASSADGNASQKLTGNELVLTIDDQPLGWVSVDVTAFIQADLNNGYNWSAYSFHAYHEWYGPYGFGFVAADSASGNGAYLSIVTVPEPAAAGMAAVATGVLLVRRKRA